VALEVAERDYSAVEVRLRAEAGPQGFEAKRKQLAALRSDYFNLPAEDPVSWIT
jgi:hypothetical protein